MKRYIFLVAGVFAIVAAVWFYFGGTTNELKHVPLQAQGQKDVYYCPMHKEYKSDKPGNCPICSMKLVKEEKAPTMPMGATAQSKPEETGVAITPEKQQLIGMRSEPAVFKMVVKDIRAVGKVAYDETRVMHIHSKVNGYIEETFADFVGQAVKKGDRLFTIYSPDLVATQHEYLLALKSHDVLKNSSFPSIAAGSENLVEASRERLRLWDVSDEEIDGLARDGKVKRALAIYSPVSGIVTERTAYHHGKFVTPEMDLYTLVDLSRVWVLGEIYEPDLPLVRLGQSADVELPEGKTLRGKIDFLSPFIDPKTRTGHVRLEFPNPGLSLRPDEFVNINLHVNLGTRLVVPEDSVLNSGTEQYVFIDKGDGYLEPRLVKTAAQAGGYYAVSSGLRAGERVVTSANFIVDSDSRLKGAFANMGKPATQAEAPVPQDAARLNVEVLEPKQAKVGMNPIRILVKDSSGAPIDNAEVQVKLFMPQMGSMPPSFSEAMLKARGKGEYAGSIELQMASTWQTTIVVKKGGTALGTAATTITAR